MKVTVVSDSYPSDIPAVTTLYTVNLLDDCDPLPDFTHTPNSDTINYIVDTDIGTTKFIAITAWAQNNCKYIEVLTILPDTTDAAYPWITFDNAR